MHPEIFGVRVYYPILLCSIVAVIAITTSILGAHGYHRGRIFIYMLIGIVPPALGAKAYSILLHNGFRGIDVELAGGYRYPGSVVGSILGLYLLKRLLPLDLSVARFADTFAPAMGIANAIGRIGCFLTGCCHGTICYLPWAVRYPRGSIAWHEHYEAGQIAAWSFTSLPVHPLPLYYITMELGVAAFCFWYSKRKVFDGQIALLFLVLEGSFRFALEFFRHAYHPLHQTLIIVSALALAVMLHQHRRVRAHGVAA